MRRSALMTLQFLVFPHGPVDQNTIQDPEGRLQLCFVVLPIIVHPPAQDGIAHVGEVVESLRTAEMQAPTPDRLPHRFGGPGTDRGGEVETVLPPAMLRPSWTKRRAQEVQAVGRRGAPPIRIFAVHDVGLVRMPFQVALGQPGRDAGLEPARWRCTLTMRDALLGRALEGDGRLFPVPPGSARVRPEELGEDGAETAPVRHPLAPLDEGAILALHGGL
jgi:hypothetical protein